MSNVTSDQFDQLIDELRSLNGNLVRSGTSSKPKSSANTQTNNAAKTSLSLSEKMAKAQQKANEAIDKADKTFRHLDKEVSSVTSSLKMLTQMLTVGGAIKGIFNALTQSADKYRELASVGQDFGGSMMKMQISAAEARLSLDDFAGVLKKNALTVAAMGVQPYMAMGKQLRDNLTQFGMLNMTTENLNEFMGEYMETQRSWGILQRMNTIDATDSMQKLAIETTKMSNLTGMERSAIMKRQQAALKDESLSAYMMMNEGRVSKQFTDNLQKATVYLAGLPGEAGESLSRMLGQSIGRGSAVLSDDMKGFVDAGMFGVVDLVDSMKRKIETGAPVSDEDMEQFRKNFVSMGKANMSALKFQADTGNEQARKSIKMIGELNNLDGKKLKELSEQSKVTKMVMNLQNALQNLSGWIREKFFKALSNAGMNLEKFTESPAFLKLKEMVGGMAERFGMWFAKVFTPGNVERVMQGLEDFGRAAITVASVLVAGVTKVAGWFNKVSDMFNPLVASLLLFGTVLAGKAVLGGIQNAFKAGAKHVFTLGGRVGGQGAAGAANGPNSQNSTPWPRRFIQNNSALRVYVVNQIGTLRPGQGGNDGGAGGNNGGGGNGGKGKPQAPGRGRVGRPGAAKGPSKIGRGISKVAKLGGLKGLAGGVGGLAVGAGMSLLNDSFAGKAGMGAANVLGGAAQGALTGAMFGPVGAAVGGAIGGMMSAIEHWDDLKNDISGAYDWLIDKTASGMEMISNGVASVKNFIGGVFGQVGNWIGGLFSWIGNLFTGDSILAKIISASPIGAAIMTASKIGGAIISPSTSSSPKEAPKLDSDALQNQIKNLQQQYGQLQKENQELKGQFADMKRIMEEQLAVSRAGMGGMIKEQKRGNRDLGNLANGI